MRKEYDFSDAKRANKIEHLNKLRAGKTRISIMIDNEVLAAFRKKAHASGIGYQTLMHEALRGYLADTPDITEALRRFIRREIKAA